MTPGEVQVGLAATAGQRRSFREIQAQRDATTAATNSVLDHGAALAEQNPDIAGDVRGKAAALAMPYGIANRQAEKDWDAEHTRSLATSTDPGGAEKFRRYQAGELKGYELLGDPSVSPYWKNLVAQDAMNNPRAGQRPGLNSRPGPQRGRAHEGMSPEAKQALRGTQGYQEALRNIDRAQRSGNKEEIDSAFESLAQKVVASGGIGGNRDIDHVRSVLREQVGSGGSGGRGGGRTRSPNRVVEEATRQIGTLVGRMMQGRGGGQMRDAWNAYQRAAASGDEQAMTAAETALIDVVSQSGIFNRFNDRVARESGGVVTGTSLEDAFRQQLRSSVASMQGGMQGMQGGMQGMQGMQGGMQAGASGGQRSRGAPPPPVGRTSAGVPIHSFGSADEAIRSGAQFNAGDLVQIGGTPHVAVPHTASDGTAQWAFVPSMVFGGTPVPDPGGFGSAEEWGDQISDNQRQAMIDALRNDPAMRSSLSQESRAEIDRIARSRQGLMNQSWSSRREFENAVRDLKARETQALHAAAMSGVGSRARSAASTITAEGQRRSQEQDERRNKGLTDNQSNVPVHQEAMAAWEGSQEGTQDSQFLQSGQPRGRPRADPNIERLWNLSTDQVRSDLSRMLATAGLMVGGEGVAESARALPYATLARIVQMGERGASLYAIAAEIEKVRPGFIKQHFGTDSSATSAFLQRRNEALAAVNAAIEGVGRGADRSSLIPMLQDWHATLIVGMSLGEGLLPQSEVEWFNGLMPEYQQNSQQFAIAIANGTISIPQASAPAPAAAPPAAAPRGRAAEPAQAQQPRAFESDPDKAAEAWDAKLRGMDEGQLEEYIRGFVPDNEIAQQFIRDHWKSMRPAAQAAAAQERSGFTDEYNRRLAERMEDEGIGARAPRPSPPPVRTDNVVDMSSLPPMPEPNWTPMGGPGARSVEGRWRDTMDAARRSQSASDARQNRLDQAASESESLMANTIRRGEEARRLRQAYGSPYPEKADGIVVSRTADQELLRRRRERNPRGAARVDRIIRDNDRAVADQSSIANAVRSLSGDSPSTPGAVLPTRDEAIESLERIAKQGSSGNDTAANSLLGSIYENGDYGIEKDVSKAVEHYKLAFDRYSIDRLIQIYSDGAEGVRPDPFYVGALERWLDERSAEPLPPADYAPEA